MVSRNPPSAKPLLARLDRQLSADHRKDGRDDAHGVL